jgi:hypothetical protein
MAGVDTVRLANALGLRLAVAAGQRDVDDARALGPARLSAFPGAGKPLQIAASCRNRTRELLHGASTPRHSPIMAGKVQETGGGVEKDCKRRRYVRK